MKRRLVTAVISLHAPLLLAADPPVLAITDAVIHQAVKETLAEAAAEARPNSSTNTNTNNAPTVRAADRIEQRMREAFDEAKVPDCLHPDAMKLTPPRIGPINLAGIYAAPFWAYAALSGKCR